MKKKKLVYIWALALLILQILLPPIALAIEKPNQGTSSETMVTQKESSTSETTSSSSYQTTSNNSTDTSKTEIATGTTSDVSLNDSNASLKKAARASADITDKVTIESKKIFINKVEYVPGATAKLGDQLDIEVYWNIANTNSINSGDYFIIPLSVTGVDLSTTSENAYSLKVEGSEVEIGRWGVAKESDGHYYLKCTFNEEIEKVNALKNGKFFAGGGINKEGNLEIEIAGDGETIEIPVEGGGSDIGIISPSGNTEKWGWQNQNDVNRINWEIGINRTNFFDTLTGKVTDIASIKRSNVLFVDELQKGQTVALGNLSAWIGWPMVVEYKGKLQAANPYLLTGMFSSNFNAVNYQEGETESHFKERVRNSIAPSVGIFPMDKHTSEANAPDDGDYIYINFGDLPGSLLSDKKKVDFYQAIDNLNYPQEVKQTTQEAYDRYFSLLGVGENDYVPAISPIVKFRTRVPEGTKSQDIANTAKLEFNTGTEESNSTYVEYKDFNGTVGAVEKGNVKIIKFDKNTNEKISNIEFSLYQKVGSEYTLLKKGNTETSGEIEFKNIGIGNFVLVESNSQNYDPNSLEIKDNQNNDILVNDYTIDSMTYKGFEFSVTGDENQGFGFVATNKKMNVSTSLKANKVLTGKTLQAGAFTFELKDESGKVIDTTTNAANGAINFKAIDYDQAGEYNYTISEVAGNIAGLTYDNHELKVKVTVKDENGKLVATAEYEGDQTFTNSYKPGPGSVVLQANKVLTGKTLQAGDFTFELKDENGTVIDTATNDANGAINFKTIDYDQAGEYNYTISEVAGNTTGLTYDDHELKVKVTVKDENGKFVATAEYEGDQTFTNSYKPGPGSVVLQANKVLTGKTLQAGDFTFELKDESGKVIDTATNDAKGVINFKAINYDQAGEYNYTITEVAGKASGITYDDHKLKVAVKVTEKKDKLTAIVNYEGDQTFTNSYSQDPGRTESDQNNTPNQKTVSPSSPTFTPTKKLPSTGEKNTMTYTLIGLVILVVAGSLFYLRKKDSK